MYKFLWSRCILVIWLKLELYTETLVRFLVDYPSIFIDVNKI